MSANMIGSGTPWRLAYNPGVPLTGSFWFYPTNSVSTAQFLLTYQNTAGSQYYAVTLDGTNGQVLIDCTDGVSFPANSCFAGTANMNAWNHLFFCFDSPLRGALNGGTSDTSSSGIFPTVTVIRMGARQTATFPATYGNHFTGLVSELAFWTVDIYATNNDFYKAAASKFCPLLLPTVGLLPTRYWPFINTAVDRMVGTPAWTVPSGTAYGDHCPQIYNASSIGGARAG